MDWYNSLCALIVKTEGSLGNHKNVDSGNVMQKSFVVYSKILFVQNAFQLCWNETAIRGLEITRKKKSSSHVLHATTKQVISSRLLEENGREMY